VVADPARQLRAARGARLLESLLLEAWPVVVVAFAVLIALANTVGTSWAGILFDNADSIVLPLMRESLDRGEPQQWVFSSQAFLFPEGLLYAFSSLFSSSIRMTLAINAVLNVVVLYGAFRVIAYLLAHRSRHRFVEIFIALTSALGFVLLVLLERNGNVNLSGLATPYLATTYYYGVVLSGLVTIALILWVTRSFGPMAWGRMRMAIFASVLVAVAALTTFSNPLYLVQVFAPISVVLLILLFFARVTWRRASYLGAVLVVGVLLGMLFRAVFSSLFPAVLKQYVSLDSIPSSIRQVHLTLNEMLSSGQGELRFLLIGFLLLVSVIIFAFASFAQARPNLSPRVSTEEIFIAGFVLVSSVSLTVGMVVTGSITTRYLEPLTIFPLLTLMSVGIHVLRRMLAEVKKASLRRSLVRYLVVIAGVASALIVILGAVSIPAVSKLIDDDQYITSDCLDHYLGNSGRNGVGSFWLSRPIQLYGEQKGEVLQVNPDMSPYEWMINMGSYEQTDFSYVLIDRVSAPSATDTEGALGRPARIVSCGGYDIFDYAGTAGETTLNRIISTSVAKFLDK